MDEPETGPDKEWLDAMNAERKKDQLDKITYETFEVVMDRLEKEWFDLTKNIPKPDFAMPSEDSTCAICDDSEGENANAIVFCDGCNLAIAMESPISPKGSGFVGSAPSPQKILPYVLDEEYV
ncbi:hypothetical protein PM082_007736 [Marasmius tenuissimus]|nr:hypothetical protein PM082_007736 [Marasmius tenuissimus]